MLVTLPFVLLLLDYWPLGRFELSTFNFQLSTFNRLIREKLPFFALALASSIITVVAQKNSGSIVPLEVLPIGARLANAVVAAAAYLEKTCWPQNLAVLYLCPASWPFWKIGLSVCILAGVCRLVAGQWRRQPWLLVGWLWFLGMLAPVIGLVQVGSQFMADRYAYLPHIGCFMMLAWGGWDLASRWRVAKAPLIALAAAALVSAALVARHQVAYWQNSETLWRRCLAVAGPNYMAENGLGTALVQQERLQEAEPHFRASLELVPDYVIALNNLGMLLAMEGKTEEALPYVEQVMRLYPGKLDECINMSLAFDAQGQTEKAIAFYRLATRLSPFRINAVFLLAIPDLGWPIAQ